MANVPLVAVNFYKFSFSTNHTSCHSIFPGANNYYAMIRKITSNNFSVNFYICIVAIPASEKFLKVNKPIIGCLSWYLNRVPLGLYRNRQGITDAPGMHRSHISRLVDTDPCRTVSPSGAYVGSMYMVSSWILVSLWILVVVMGINSFVLVILPGDSGSYWTR